RLRQRGYGRAARPRSASLPGRRSGLIRALVVTSLAWSLPRIVRAVSREEHRMRRVMSVVISAAAVLALAAAPASAGGREVRREGSCSAASDWKLKGKADDRPPRVGV